MARSPDASTSPATVIISRCGMRVQFRYVWVKPLLVRAGMFSRLALISTSTRYSWPGLTPQSYHAGRYLGVRPRRSSSVSPVSEPKRQTRPYGGIGGFAFFTTRVIGATIAARAHLGRSCGYSECHLHRSSSDRPAGSHRAPGNPALFLLLPNKTPDWSSNWPFCAGPGQRAILGPQRLHAASPPPGWAVCALRPQRGRKYVLVGSDGRIRRRTVTSGGV
jgi:hypothetical protein